MHKNQESSQNFAAGARVWFFCCVFFLLSISACNLPAKEGAINPIPPVMILPTPSSTILPPSQIPPTPTLSSPSSTSTVLPTGQITSTAKLSSPSPTTTVLPVNQASPTATLSSPFPNSAKAKFSISSANQSVPEDILQEVWYFGGGSGGNNISCKNIAYSRPDIEQPSGDHELTKYIDISSCGWQSEENIILTITYPNGEIDKRTLTASESPAGIDLKIYGVFFIFWPQLKDPAGTYTLVLTGAKEQLKISIDVKEPSGTHVYEKEDFGLFLYKFLPNEKVRLFAYDLLPLPNWADARLIGWQTYQVDNSGQLFIDTTEDYLYIIVGETSGEIHPQSITNEVYVITPIKNSCPGAPPIRLTFYKKARVTITTGSSLRVRQSPGIQGKEINKLKEGTVVDIIEGPTCVDRMNWWKIKSKDGITGWSSEGDLKVYNLEPWD